LIVSFVEGNGGESEGGVTVGCSRIASNCFCHLLTCVEIAGFVFGFVGLENRYQIVVNYRMNKNDFLFLIYLQYSSMSIYKLVNYFVVA
jgi:hypothetical protein